jgi:hypothetical protein
LHRFVYFGKIVNFSSQEQLSKEKTMIITSLGCGAYLLCPKYFPPFKSALHPKASSLKTAESAFWFFC